MRKALRMRLVDLHCRDSSKWRPKNASEKSPGSSVAISGPCNLQGADCDRCKTKKITQKSRQKRRQRLME